MSPDLTIPVEMVFRNFVAIAFVWMLFMFGLGAVVIHYLQEILAILAKEAKRD